MKEKKFYLFGALFALLMMLMLVPSQSVSAANPWKKTLKTDKTYKSYDITGDKKADKIKIKTTWYDSYHYSLKKVQVVVNGQTRYTKTYEEGEKGVCAELYTLKNGKPFLHLLVYGLDIDSYTDVLLRYKSGKLKTVLNLRSQLSKFGGISDEEKIKVSGNKLRIQLYFLSYTTGYSTVTFNYKYKGGKFKRTSNTTTTFNLDSPSAYYSTRKKNNFTTSKKLTTYTSPNNGKKQTLSKGSKIKITKVYLKGSKMYLKYKARNSGKTGWIKCYKKVHRSYPFKNIAPFG